MGPRKIVMFTPKVIDQYYGLIWNNIVPIALEHNWLELAQVLYGRENAWPLRTIEQRSNELTLSVALLWIFICHKIDPTLHRTAFNNAKAKFLFHLVIG